MSGPEEKKAVNSPQDKKTAVLEAVISLVMEGKSLEALTVSETAARAGIGKGTVYEYFPSKEAMTAAAVCYYMRRELTALQSLIPLDRGFRIAAESSMTTVAEAVQSRLSFFHMVSGFSCFEMKRCLEGQEPAEEIRNVVQEQIRRILALGAEEGLISGGFSEEFQTMCFLGAVGSYLASLQAQLLPEPQARAYAYQMLIRSLSAASPAEAPAL